MDNFKLIADSSCDLTAKLKEKLSITLVPLTLQLKNKIYKDDETLDVKKYLKEMKECDESPKTSCPSPEDFMNAYEGDEENVFVVTLSSKLSGTYNSAKVAKDLFNEDNKKKNIHVFDSKSASIGETLIALKINELASKNININELISKIETYIEEMKTFFVLDNLDHLAKAGRLNLIAAKLINVLNIKLVLGSTDDGEIKMVDRARGHKKVFQKFVDTIGKEGKNLENKILGIAHCNCLERALAFKDEVLKRYNFKDIVIVETSGLSSTYADEGGIVIAF